MVWFASRNSCFAKYCARIHMTTGHSIRKWQPAPAVSDGLDSTAKKKLDRLHMPLGSCQMHWSSIIVVALLKVDLLFMKSSQGADIPFAGCPERI